MALTSTQERLVLAAITAACLAPFLGKAFHVDEPLFIWMAQQIQRHPLDPYGLTVNWYGTVVPMAEAMRNPPFAPYVMALWGSVAGWSEVSLHALFLIPAIAAVLGVHSLAAPLCRRPFLAACISAASPAFLVSSTSIMCDVMMLASFVWSLSLWMQGIDNGDRRRLLGAVALATLCALTKYNGATVVPLLVLYALWRKQSRALTYAALPAVAVAGYLAIMLQRYGSHSLWQAVAMATDDHADASASAIASQAVVTLSFLGGCYISMLLYAVVLWPSRAWIIGAGLAGAWLWTPSISGLAAAGPARAMQFLAFAAGGVIFLALSISDVRRKLDAVSGLLLCWLAGTVLFSGVVSWSVSARYLLLLAPVSGILAVRALDRRRLDGWRVWAPAATALVVSLSVAQADAALARSARSAATTIVQAHAGQPGTLWYQGHWGFQYYMDLGGAKAVDFEKPWFATGDEMIIPANNANISVIDPKWVRSSETLQFPVSAWLSTLNPQVGAGFYSSVFGPLPFVFGPAPAERYTTVKIGAR